MSHWTKVKTNISDSETLVKALQRMGLTAEAGDFTITEYGTSEKAQIRLHKAVGMAKQEDGTYAMVGDFYHVPGGNKLRGYYGQVQRFSSELAVAYARCEDEEELELQGFFPVEEEVQKDGSLNVVYQRGI